MTPTILIIDDQQSFLDIFQSILADSGFNVVQSVSGLTGCSLARHIQPDVIVTDWEMPGMKGDETIKRLKDFEETCDIPIIMATGVMLSVKDLEYALALGAVDYIQKPFEKVEMLARINSALRISNIHKTTIFQRDELKALNDTKDRFVEILTNDLRDPISRLNAIFDKVDENISQITKEEVIESILAIKREEQAIFGILSNLTTWARSQNKSVAYNPKMHFLNKLIVKNIKKFESVSRKKRISVQFSNDDNIYAFYDFDMINLVMRNILGNAIKYSNENGEIVVSIAKKSDYAVVSVLDNGIGIAKENLERIFRMGGSHENSQGTMGEVGSGLGLIIAKDFISKNKGKIWIESKVGKGTTVKFSIPLLSETTN